MPAGLYNIVIEQGATFKRTLTWRNADGDLVNLTGYTARMTVAETYGGTALVEITESTGITLGGALGTIELLVADTATDIDAGEKVWELVLTDAGGDGTVTRLLEGKATVTQQVNA